MNIKQVEELTGITKQNIRFYEKQGLITPGRNKDNDYREYYTEDVRCLKTVKVLRKLGMPIEEIRQVLDEKISLNAAMQQQKEKLEGERQNLDAAIRLCQELESQSLQTLDVDRYINWIENEESKGNTFLDIWNDFRQVARAEEKKAFSFMPDDFVQNPEEFTNALLKYAKDNEKDIIITKESMYPEFMMDGVAYSAYRCHGRFGAVVRCEVSDPRVVEPIGIPEKRRKMLKMLVRVLPILLLLLLLILLFISRYYKEDALSSLLGVASLMTFLCSVYYLYRNVKG